MHKPLWCLSIRTTPQAEETIRGELFALTGSCPVVRSRPQARTVWIESYFASRSQLRPVQKQMADYSPQVRQIAYENWAQSWKKHFGVQRVGKRIVITPSWKSYRARRDEIVLELDPGLSFGTGQHATTRFCLKMIERLADTRPLSLMDVGTGSGILAIAATKLGYRPVLALDNDPQAIRVARRNLSQNQTRVRARVSSLEAVDSRPAYDVVVANILADILLAHRRKLASLVADGGHLILAGILAREAAQVCRAFRARGLETFACERTRDWAGLVFRKPSKRRRR